MLRIPDAEQETPPVIDMINLEEPQIWTPNSTTLQLDSTASTSHFVAGVSLKVVNQHSQIKQVKL